MTADLEFLKLAGDLSKTLKEYADVVKVFYDKAPPCCDVSFQDAADVGLSFFNEGDTLARQRSKG